MLNRKIVLSQAEVLISELQNMTQILQEENFDTQILDLELLQLLVQRLRFVLLSWATAWRLLYCCHNFNDRQVFPLVLPLGVFCWVTVSIKRKFPLRTIRKQRAYYYKASSTMAMALCAIGRRSLP